MDLAPTEEHAELIAAVRDYCRREVTPERLLQWEAKPGLVDAQLRPAIAALGWLGLGVPTSAGGSGASLLDVAFLLEEGARGLLPRPLAASIRASTALARLDPASSVLSDLAAGRRTLALALDEESARRPSAYRTTIAASGSGAVVNGAKAYVPEGADADLHLVAAREGSGVSLVLVERAAAGVSIASLRGFGGDRQAHVTYAGAPVLARVSAPGGGAAAFERLQREQLALALAEMIGGMEEVVAMTVAYVKEREQFGQKIALFQAVRHQVADIGTTLTAARHLAWQAITRVAKDALQGDELASAAAFVGQGFKRVCWTGHHLHGGAGFVVEHRLRFHSERAQSLCIRYAAEEPALAQIAASLLD
jgi:alkylation response protein AidB-like acyl-CoA dehydrogenase